MNYLTEFDKDRNWKALTNLLGTFQAGNSPYRLYPRCVFDDYANQTFMSCAGYIAGTYHAGNIDLAGSMAHCLHECFEYLCMPSTDTPDQSMLAFVSSDNCNLSFGFGLYMRLPESSEQWDSEEVQVRFKLRHVRYYKGRYWNLYYNGGIIFCAGGVRPHKLEAGDRPWSTHS